MNIETNKTREIRPQSQQGVVLFFALIALVAMSLAAVALIRSVDTNTMIAGNLAYKQSVMNSSDRGVETAITWLRGRTVVNLRNHVAANGYYASTTDPLIGNARALVLARPSVTDAQGNQIQFVIQRMCRNQGQETIDNCMFGPEGDSASSHDPLVVPSPSKSLIYRITVRTVGPKNTESYIQTFAY